MAVMTGWRIAVTISQRQLGFLFIKLLRQTACPLVRTLKHQTALGVAYTRSMFLARRRIISRGLDLDTEISIELTEKALDKK